MFSNNFVPVLMPLTDLVANFPTNEETEIDVYNYLTQDNRRFQYFPTTTSLFTTLPNPSSSSSSSFSSLSHTFKPLQVTSPIVPTTTTTTTDTTTTTTTTKPLSQSEKKRKIKEKVYLQKIKIMKLSQQTNGLSGEEIALGWKEYEASQLEKEKEKDKDKVAEKEKKKRKCTNCKTGCSPIWRFGVNNEILCNACGLYYRQHKEHRPLSIQKKGQKKGVVDPTHFCSLCGSRQTSIWRRGLDGQRLCNACGIKIRYKNKEKPTSTSTSTSSNSVSNTILSSSAILSTPVTSSSPIASTAFNLSTPYESETQQQQFHFLTTNCTHHHHHHHQQQQQQKFVKDDKDFYLHADSRLRSMSPSIETLENSSPLMEEDEEDDKMKLGTSQGLHVAFHSLFTPSSSSSLNPLHHHHHHHHVSRLLNKNEDMEAHSGSSPSYYDSASDNEFEPLPIKVDLSNFSCSNWN